jgi:hypothetical protein
VRAMQRGDHLENALDQARLGRANCESVGESNLQTVFKTLESQILLQLGQFRAAEGANRSAIGLQPTPVQSSGATSSVLVVLQQGDGVNSPSVGSGGDGYAVSEEILLGRRWRAQAMVQYAKQILAPRGEVDAAIKMLSTAAQLFESDLTALGALASLPTGASGRGGPDVQGEQ